jgi:hypothetical protein
MSPSRAPEPPVSAPAPERGPRAPRAAWHGQASVWGSVCGVIAASVVMGAPGSARISPYALVWGIGLALLLVPGRARRFGVGLLASGLVGATLVVWGQVQGVMWGHP